MSLEIGKKIAALRKMQGVTQVQLADYLMVHPQTVSRWESEGGTPDVMLLPKIASFFGISMDELFGITDMEQIDHLVYKYSVLRDEKSFKEVIGRIGSALASLEEGKDTEKREQLLAWKVHIYIQKSRKAQEEAEEILDELRENLSQASKLAMPLKLQKNQFLIQKGEGRAVLKEVKADWEEERSVETLYCYMMALSELDRARECMELWEQSQVQKIVMDINADTIPLWQMLFRCIAAEEEESYYINLLNIFRTKADEYAVFEAEWTYAGLLTRLGREEEKEAEKKQLLEKVETLPINEYLKMNYVKRMQEL